HAKPDLRITPAVVRVVAGTIFKRILVEIPQVDPVMRVRSEGTAVLQGHATLLIACMNVQQPALGIGSLAGNDVDHTIDGVGPPQRTTRTADNLDALYVLRQYVLVIPVHAREDRRIHAAAVNQHQQLVGEVLPDVGAA